MTETISLPLWLVIIGGALAAWALLDRLLLPSVRWYFRRRINIVIKEINERLDLSLPAFKLTKRRILEDRSLLLSIDPDAPKRSRLSVIKTTLFFITRNLWPMLRGRWYRYG